MKICWPRLQLVFTFDNRFSSTVWAVPQSVWCITFRLQARYLSATSHTGRKSCRVKSLYMKRFWSPFPLPPLPPPMNVLTEHWQHEANIQGGGKNGSHRLEIYVQKPARAGGGGGGDGVTHWLTNCKETKTKCRLYRCSIEFIDWRYSQLCWCSTQLCELLQL